MDHQTLLTIPIPISTSPQPETNSNTTHSTAGASIRLTAIIVLVAVSIWANFEASKFFDIKFINGAKHTQQGKQFQLMFISNGQAERLLLNSSRFVEHILFPNNLYPKKPVSKVTVYFSAQKMANSVVVSANAFKSDEFIITLSPEIMSVAAEADRSVAAALQLGMAYVWLWNGNGNTPKPLANAMAEFFLVSNGLIASQSSVMKQNTSCWDDENSTAVARFLKYCNDRRRGFFAQFNSAMKDEFDEVMVDKALGVSVHSFCSAYLSSIKDREVISLSSVGYDKYVAIDEHLRGLVM